MPGPVEDSSRARVFQEKSKRSRQKRVAPVAVIRIEFAARATTGLAVGRRSSRAARNSRLHPVPRGIVMFELEYGCAKSKRPEEMRRALEIFLSAGFDQPAFDIEDAREAGEIRALLEARGQPIGPCDTLIAAQARRRGAVLVTLNTREFERAPGLRVEDWAA